MLFLSERSRSEIQSIFSKYGNVHDVHIPRDYYTQ